MHNVKVIGQDFTAGFSSNVVCSISKDILFDKLDTIFAPIELREREWVCVCV